MVVVLVFLLWAVIGLTGYFNVSTSNNTSTTEYNISDSTFKISDWWECLNKTNDSIIFDNWNGMPYANQGRGKKRINLTVTQYSTKFTYESNYQDLITSPDNLKVLNNTNLSIGGIEVKFINSTDPNSSNTYQFYYFQKNGKYYSINISGEAYAVNELLGDAIKNSLETIISTIN
ncbi:hypothetical protein [Methanobacterium aggregans]|uniref:hypothetical protein n=1 Tax=Methanobacterium aggregans TaxID=1615586 RepID=UPI00320CB838